MVCELQRPEVGNSKFKVKNGSFSATTDQSLSLMVLLLGPDFRRIRNLIKSCLFSPAQTASRRWLPSIRAAFESFLWPVHFACVVSQMSMHPLLLSLSLQPRYAPTLFNPPRAPTCTSLRLAVDQGP